MVLSYDYANPNRQRQRTNAPPTATNECTSVAGHLDVEGLKRLMRHWMPPSGDYLLHITPAAARATPNNTKM
jgi:hypothetical protein